MVGRLRGVEAKIGRGDTLLMLRWHVARIEGDVRAEQAAEEMHRLQNARPGDGK